MTIQQKIRDVFILPVAVIEREETAAPLAEALSEGGIPVIEVTMRTEAALRSIAVIKEQCPSVTVGAGTVITAAQCKAAIRAGAEFIVSPGFDAEVVRICRGKGINVFPGCVTPTEITRALSMGLSVVKFFPQDVYGGLKAMKALRGPFPDLRFIPTGGINLANLAQFLDPAVFAIGGGWLCPKDAVLQGDFALITKNARDAVEKTRGEARV